MTPVRALFVAVFAALALGPQVAQAEPTDAQKKEARELNEKATRYYEVGRYGEAIEEYQKVYLLVEDPVLLYNIAQSFRLWGKPEDAIRFYRNYLRRSPAAANRADVEKKIGDLERVIEERKRLAPSIPSPTPPPTPVPAPPPAPEVSAAPPAPVSPPVVAPPPAPVVEAPVTTVVQPSAPAPESHRGQSIAGVSFLIGGGVLVASSVVAGLVAAQKAKDLERMSMDPSRPVFDPSIERSGKSANKVAIVTGVLGAIAGITGGVLMLTAGPSSSPVAVYPLVGPTLAGGGARVSF